MSASSSPDAATLIEQGLAFHRQGRLDEARACYAQALRAEPENADAWHLLGVVLAALGQTAEGIEHLRRAIALRPDFAAAHNNLGNAYRAGAQWEAAVAAYRAALAARPDYPAALNNLGCVLKAQDHLPEAADLLRRALQLDPDYAEAYYNLGNTLLALGDRDAALAAYHAGLVRQPDDVDLLLALAKAHHRYDQEVEALAVLARVLALAPRWADAWNTLGAVREEDGAMIAARDAYRQAVELAPALADAQLNLGTAELCLGNFPAGWRGYAYRPRQAGLPDPLACVGRGVMPAALAGRSVLLYAEQGLGDTLQFARYAPLLVAAGARVALLAPPPLKALLAASLPTVSVFAPEDAPPAADEHWPLLSLPLVFGTGLASIPAPIPYVAPRVAVARWAARLPPARVGVPRVGVAWSGNPRHENDRRRSLSLEHFASLLTGFRGEFFCLQTEIRPADRARMGMLPNLVDLSPDIGDFADTAAIVENLDLVIAVDTSIAHLAGAMGKPVWLLLPFVPDWRWLLDRDDSPWYPRMRLFRQSSPGDWAGVLRRVAEALRHDYDTV